MAERPNGADRPVVTVIGLGPGAPDLLTERTRAVLARSDPLFLRTARHPGSEEFSGRAVSFDPVYEESTSFDQVYGTIADEVSAAAVANGRATYCVPGSPLVLERSVTELRNRTDVTVELVPAVSFLDEVWARLGVDPVDEGVRLVDGHRFATEAAGERGPLLVAHVHAQWVLSDIKLALLDHDDPVDDPAIVLQRLGTAEEQVVEVPVVDLDRAVEADHLTSVYLPSLAAPVGRALLGSVELMRRLRVDCPWDRSQDHASLRRYLLEEAYEVIDVLDRIVRLQATDHDDEALIDAFDELEGELGDLWLQILFHSRLASEAGFFDVADVASTLTAKMIRRHPHVFGTDNPSLGSRVSGEAVTASELDAQWDRLKADEGFRSVALDGVPVAMPSLVRASKVMKRLAAEYGPPGEGAWLARLAPSGEREIDVTELGRLLLAAVHLARSAGLDAEQALRETTNELVEAVQDGARRGGRPNWVVG